MIFIFERPYVRKQRERAAFARNELKTRLFPLIPNLALERNPPAEKARCWEHRALCALVSLRDGYQLTMPL